jgi:hypothetical protein
MGSNSLVDISWRDLFLHIGDVHRALVGGNLRPVSDPRQRAVLIEAYLR